MTDLKPRAAVSPSHPEVPAPPPVLELRKVDLSYGKTQVVRGVSFTLAAGEWLAVIGPNGAGKSSILKALAGILPFDGTIEVAGARHRKRTAAARQIGYVAQKPIMPAGMSTAEYVLLGRTAHLGWMGTESAEDRGRVAEVLDRLELGAMAGRPIDELSGGEAQRATLARALVQEAKILVLDEPTSALDLAHQISVLELVDELRVERDLAVVSAMHDLTIASRFAERLLLLADGVPVATGAATEVLTEDVLSRHYGTPVSVTEGPDGGVVVLPLRTKKPNEQPRLGEIR